MDKSLLEAYIKTILNEALTPDQVSKVEDKYKSIYSGMLKGNKKKLMKYVDPKFNRPNPDAMAMGRAINLVKKDSDKEEVNENEAAFEWNKARAARIMNDLFGSDFQFDYTYKLEGDRIIIHPEGYNDDGTLFDMKDVHKEKIIRTFRDKMPSANAKPNNGGGITVHLKESVNEEIIDWPGEINYGGKRYVFFRQKDGKVTYEHEKYKGDKLTFGSKKEMDDFLGDYTAPKGGTQSSQFEESLNLDPYYGFSDKTLRGALMKTMKISPTDLKAKEDLKKLSRDELEKKLNSLKGRGKTNERLSSMVREVYTKQQQQFMCAMTKPGVKRPKGLSKAEAEEMCKDTAISKKKLQEKIKMELSEYFMLMNPSKKRGGGRNYPSEYLGVLAYYQHSVLKIPRHERAKATVGADMHDRYGQEVWDIISNNYPSLGLDPTPPSNWKDTARLLAGKFKEADLSYYRDLKKPFLNEERTSTVSKSRAKSELKQMLQGYRDDGMGKSTLKAVLAIDKDGKETKIKKLEDFSKFEKGTKFALKETTMENDRLTELIKAALKGPVKEDWEATEMEKKKDYGATLNPASISKVDRSDLDVSKKDEAISYVLAQLKDFISMVEDPNHKRVFNTMIKKLEDAKKEKSEANESFDSLSKKLDKQKGIDKEEADKIAGSIAAKKMKGAGKGPTAKQKKRVSEDKDWIQKAIKRPGALHRELGVPQDKDIPKSLINKTLAKLKKKDKDDEEEGTQLGAADERELRQLNLAKTLSKFNESLSEGYTEDNKLSDFMKTRGTADVNLWHVVRLIDAGIISNDKKEKALLALDPGDPWGFKEYKEAEIDENKLAERIIKRLRESK